MFFHRRSAAENLRVDGGHCWFILGRRAKNIVQVEIVEIFVIVGIVTAKALPVFLEDRVGSGGRWRWTCHVCNHRFRLLTDQAVKGCQGLSNIEG